jgi:hypothetical protein
MSDHGRMEQALALITASGANEVLQAMYRRGGVATFAQIAADLLRPLTMLRALAAEGFVISYGCGTLDVEPSAGMIFGLTTKGEAVAGHLDRLQQWNKTRSGRRTQPPPASP